MAVVAKDRPPDRVDPVMEEAWRWILGLRPRGIRLGLERVERALALLGDPQDRLRAVTIAGTNGKGSTASFLASMAHTAGYRVGLYTSPHLTSVNERIRIGNLAILPQDFVRWAERVRAVVDGRGGVREPVPLTFFEALTVMAIGYFAEREVDLAVLEVGMGGRLDATAAVPPLVSVITPIGLDHQEFLGDDLVSICREKAGIMAPGATVVSNVSGELFRGVVGPRAFELRCPIRRAGVDYVWQWLDGGFRYRGWINRLGPVPLGLRGTHQGDNAAAACAAAESLMAHGFHFKPVAMAEGLHRTRHPGRLDRREPTLGVDGAPWPALLLDGAHNPMAAEVLAAQLDDHLPERPRVMVFGVKHDKDYSEMLDALAPRVDAVVLTASDHADMLRPQELRGAARRGAGPEVLVEPELAAALQHARHLATPRGGLLITGSLYLVGDAMRHLPG